LLHAVNFYILFFKIFFSSHSGVLHSWHFKFWLLRLYNFLSLSFLILKIRVIPI
jgi:hypothetical protein